MSDAQTKPATKDPAEPEETGTQLNIVTPFFLTENDGRVRHYGVGIHDFDTPYDEHWYVLAHSEFPPENVPAAGTQDFAAAMAKEQRRRNLINASAEQAGELAKRETMDEVGREQYKMALEEEARMEEEQAAADAEQREADAKRTAETRAKRPTFSRQPPAAATKPTPTPAAATAAHPPADDKKK